MCSSPPVCFLAGSPCFLEEGRKPAVSRTQTCALCWGVIWSGEGEGVLLRALLLLYLPKISLKFPCFSSASLAYLVQEGGRWPLMCLLQLLSGSVFLFVGCYWTQRFTKTTICLPAQLRPCVLRTRYTILSHARLHRCCVRGETHQRSAR